MFRELFQEQRRYLDTFYDRLDIEEVEGFFQECLACEGLLLLTGVGKSGTIAEKIAATLVSTGTRALFLSPRNLLHGDLGVLTEHDRLIFFSKSGETEELLDLIPHARRRGVRMMGVLSKRGSPLEHECDCAVHLEVERELCPFDLVPTTSTEVQLLFGDALAIGLMKKKRFSVDEFALNHPLGSIGRRLSKTVGELMHKDEMIPLAHPTEKVKEAIHKMRFGALVVVDGAMELIGVFTDGDLRRALQKGDAIGEHEVSSFMTHTPITLTAEMRAWEAMKWLQRDPKRWVLVAPVLSDGKVVGIIQMHDLVRAGISALPTPK